MGRPKETVTVARRGIDAPTGSLVSTVVPDGPADEAGLQGADSGPDARILFQGGPVRTGGDVIVAVDGEELVNENDLSRLISENLPGDTVTLTIIRDGEEQEIDVELGTRPTG